MPLRSSLREPSKRVVIRVKWKSDRRDIHVSSFPNTYKNSFFIKKKKKKKKKKNLGSPGPATRMCVGRPSGRSAHVRIVRPGARRGDDDLGAVTHRNGQVEGRAVTASSHGVRGRQSTSDIPSTSAPIAPGMYYNPGAPGSSTQSPYTV
ncbi:hypothetical protein M9H77_12419 [Catharanthus roseus]|uniref:Uncharacterized protein n=1 Tax=Catharanthus roseus TaxID=4058 RepID=A0ACC0BHE0_CATRO|nr:hypothetical protein M9H77_12419 [Catharanthus roseus]